MEKIVSLFVRDYDGDRFVRDEIVPGAEWVVAGEGVATRKFDGQACKIEDGRMWRRYDCKRGRTPPPDFVAAQDADPKTGHWPGWVPVTDGPGDAQFRAAFMSLAADGQVEDGSYELLTPTFLGRDISKPNPEEVLAPRLVRHGALVLDNVPRDFEGLRAYLATHDVEGIVWHHPDGRLVKIKGRDFGVDRGVAARNA